jgi:hypothetical protein
MNRPHPLRAGVAPLADLRIIVCGAQKCAAHRLHRLTQQRPACERPTRGRGGVGVATAARFRVNVTGKSTRPIDYIPPGTWPVPAQKLADRRRKATFSGHPAVALSFHDSTSRRTA